MEPVKVNSLLKSPDCVVSPQPENANNVDIKSAIAINRDKTLFMHYLPIF